MRLKSFTAATMAEAMEMVRAELGEDAIIVSTQRAASGTGIRVSAALEETGLDEDLAELLTAGGASSAVAEEVRSVLAGHGTPEPLIDQIVHVIRKQQGRDVFDACVAAFRSGFLFAPLPRDRSPRPIMLIGPPGTGKSVTVAKLAARAVIERRSVKVLSADVVRAGALEQLEAFARILEIPVLKARSGDVLARTLDAIRGQQDLVFIDTPGLNPFSDYDMDHLRELITAADVEPILVLAAGGDPYETAEVAKIFSGLGARRLLATRLDVTRRLGSLLSAAAAADLSFSDVSLAPHVANGLEPLSAESLARLILPVEDLPDKGEHEDEWWEHTYDDIKSEAIL